MEMAENFDWNKIDWKKYPNGLFFYKKPIRGIRIPSIEKEVKFELSYWDEKKWMGKIDR